MSSPQWVWINGELLPWESATVHIMSQGFSRGSAVFEVFGVHALASGPAAFRMADHLARLENTCALLGMELAQSREMLANAVSETVKANDLKSGFVKMIGYLSADGFSNLVPAEKLDMSIFAVRPADDPASENTRSISACVSKWAKLHPKTVPVEAKVAAHYLNGMLARQDAHRRGFDVGIMKDTHGFIAEGSMESVFIVKDKSLKTPAKGRILDSITRRCLLEVARTIGIDVLEAPLSEADLLSADEMFLSCTPSKVLPVNRFEDRTFEPAPGPVTKRLSDMMGEITSGRQERFLHWLEAL